MTARNCKVGDLAIVVSAELTDNLGQIVEVLGPQTNKPTRLAGPGHVWQVRTVSGRKTLTYLFREEQRFARHAVGPAPDCRLRPISGLADDDAVHPKAELSKTAPKPKPKPKRKKGVAVRVSEEALP